MNVAMNAAQIHVRPERSDDHAAIRTVLEAAFRTPAEAGLVQQLREDGDLVLALVAQHANGRVVGHIAFPRLGIAGQGRVTRCVALAPLGVMPEMQRRGIGAALVETGLDMLARKGETLVLVLGDPAYYQRFGFAADAAEAFESPYSGPHLMAKPLVPDAPTEGVVRYPRAFADLG